MNMRYLSIFSLLIITNFVLALETDVSSYWDRLAQKAEQEDEIAYQKVQECKDALEDTRDGRIYNAHYKIFSACANLNSFEWTNLNSVPSMQGICAQNNEALIETLKTLKEDNPTQYEAYKQALKDRAYSFAMRFALSDISEQYTIYRGEWNKEKAIQHADKRRPKKYSTFSNSRFLESISDHPEYIEENVEDAIDKVKHLIKNFDKNYNNSTK